MSQESKKQKRAAAYMRPSSKLPQLWIARQMAVIRKYAKQRGLEVVMPGSDGGKGGAKA